MFAFANADGTEVLTLRTVPSPSAVAGAICGGARRFQVRHVRTQSRRPESNHRQVADNFSNEPGDVYLLESGTAVPNETCFLPMDSVVFQSAAGMTPLDGDPCAETQIRGLARLAGRDVVHCWQMAEIAGGVRFMAAQFAHVDSSALAAVALGQDSILLFHALPGRYDGPGRSIWRVDDGGVFDPASVRLLFTARLPQGLLATTVWAGAEGESEELLLADSTVHARSVLTAYRYWSPQ